MSVHPIGEHWSIYDAAPAMSVYAGPSQAAFDAEKKLRHYSTSAKGMFVRIERICKVELEKLFILKQQQLFGRREVDEGGFWMSAQNVTDVTRYFRLIAI